MDTGSGETVKARIEEIDGEELDKNLVGLIAGVVVGLITLLIIWLFVKRKSLGREVMICGVSDSGKTMLISGLVANKRVETYTSMMENKLEFLPSPNSKPLSLVDIPGHERLRVAAADKWVASARGMIFVVDCGTITKQVRDVAEYLHALLSNPTFHSNRAPVLVVCNKQDHSLAKSASVVRSALEKEIDKVRVSRSNQLEGQEGSSSGGVMLGKQGKAFQFSDLRQDFQFLEVTATEPESLKSVAQWLKVIA